MFTKFCIRAFLIVSCVFAASNLNAGVSVDTIVQTQDGPKSIRILKIGDKILCSNVAAAEFNIEEGVIKSIEEVEANEVIEITTSDNVTFYVAADQKLFVTHKWVEARQLTLEDVLLTKDRTFVKIMSIRHLQAPMTLRFITVDKHPTFWAAENGVLFHNGPYTGYSVYCATKATLIAAVAAGTFYAVCATGGMAIAATNAVAAGTAGVTGAGLGMTAAGAGAIIVEGAAISMPVGAALAASTVVVGAETTLLATGVAAGASVGATIATGTAAGTAAAGAALGIGTAAATPVAAAGTTTAAVGMTASIMAAIEAASIAAATPFVLSIWCP